MDNKVKIHIDGKEYQVLENKKLVDAAKENGRVTRHSGELATGRRCATNYIAYSSVFLTPKSTAFKTETLDPRRGKMIRRAIGIFNPTDGAKRNATERPLNEP